MDSRRFAALLVLLALVVGGGSFLVGLSLFDEYGPTEDRTEAGDGSRAEDATSTLPQAGAAGGGDLASPSWIAIVRSEADQATAEAVAVEVAADGYDTGVLRSDDYPSLNPGFWVVFAGPFADSAAANAGVTKLGQDGWPGAYVRCAGTTADCG